MVNTKGKKWGLFLFVAAVFLLMLFLVVSRYTNGKGGEGEMVLVPAGEFVMGTDKAEEKVLKSVFGEETDYEEPQDRRIVYLKDFYIDKYEVTNGQYQKFVEATQHLRIPDPWQQYGNRPPPGEEDHPVTFVSWNDAKAYAQWAGKRLPTEEEWEKAARGPDGRRYPWGMEFEKGKANTWESWGGSSGHVNPVGTHQAGLSPYGAHDMAGNAMEWTGTEVKRYSKSSSGAEGMQEDIPMIIVRGGSWSSDGVDSSTFRRFLAEPYVRSSGVGFRCAK